MGDRRYVLEFGNDNWNNRRAFCGSPNLEALILPKPFLCGVNQRGLEFIPVYMIYATLGNSVFSFETKNMQFRHKFDTKSNRADCLPGFCLQLFWCGNFFTSKSLIPPQRGFRFHRYIINERLLIRPAWHRTSESTTFGASGL